MTSHRPLLTLIEAAIMAVLAFLIALIPFDFAWVEIELGMLPIILLSYRRGLKAGLFSGFLWGMIKLLSGDIWVLTLSQVLLEYLFAFALSGLAGLAYKTIQKQIKHGENRALILSLTWSIGLACLAKYAIHFIAGVIFWSSYAPDGMGAVTYSLLVNGSSFLLTSLALLFLFIFSMPWLKNLIVPTRTS